MYRFVTIVLSCIIGSMLTFGVSHSPTKQIPKDLLPINGISIKVMPTDGLENMPSTTNAVYSSKRNSLKKQAGEANLVKVTANFPTFGEEWNINSFIIYDHVDTLYEIRVEQEYDDNGKPAPIDKWEFEIPEGLYDCMAVFYRINSELFFGEEAPVYYIIENIEVRDGCMFELKPQDSVICLNMQPAIPNGEPCRFMKADLGEDGSFTILDEGNIENIAIFNMVYFKGEIIYYANIQPWSVDLVPGLFGANDPYTYQNIYINSVSDNYLFRKIHLMTSGVSQEEDGIYVAVTEAGGSVEGEYSNGAYTLDFHEILHTPQSNNYPLIESQYEPAYPYTTTFYVPDYNTIGLQFANSFPKTWKIWNSRPENPINKDDLYYSYRRGLVDLYIQNSEDDFTIEKKITGSRNYPFASNGNNLTYFPGFPLYCIPNFALPQDCFYPGGKGFVAGSSNCEICEGGSAPLLTSYVTNTFDWGLTENLKTFGFYYTGRLGEIIESDEFLSFSSLMIDGEKVASGSVDIINWMIENPDKAGKYQIEVSTDNFEIDGIKGGNKASVNFDFSKEDKLPPSVTMLQFSNYDGTLTQTFDSAEDGVVKLSAADFEIVVGNKTGSGYIPSWFEVSVPEKVTAICNPTGSDNEIYDEIELEMHPDFFYSPGFGAFYTGSLADVSLKSSSGWFDLKLVVEDSSGNKQTQIISPAFKIDALTGINTIKKDYVKVIGNTIDAPEGSRIFGTNGVEVAPSGLSSGIYIVKTPSSVIKVAIK